MKSIEQNFHVVLFIMLYKVVLTFESVHEVLKCDHSNETIELHFPVVLFMLCFRIHIHFYCKLANSALWLPGDVIFQ